MSWTKALNCLIVKHKELLLVKENPPSKDLPSSANFLVHQVSLS